jgi:hypothetical protein
VGLDVTTATSLVRPALDRLAIAPAAYARPARFDSPLLHGMLRLACVCEFVGHGIFGMVTKAAWVPYFGVIGVPEWLAYRLMPPIGAVDIALGLLVALRPARAALLYMAIWGFITASIRPLAGEPLWEFLERAPNWAVPLAFLYVRGIGCTWKDWLS